MRIEITEKKCKKHKWFKKYSDQDVCWKCDAWRKKDEI